MVERIQQTLKRRLGVIRIDPANTSYKLVLDVAEIIKTLRITPHGVTKISLFEALMGRKLNIFHSNLATTSSATNLNWENAKHACLDQKNLTKSPLPAEIMYDLQHWSEDEVSIYQRQQLHPQSNGADKTSKQTPGTKRKRNIAINIEKKIVRNGLRHTRCS